MARILIPTYLRDIHATMVAAALREKGHEVTLWHGTDFPSRQSATIFLSKEDKLQWKVTGPGIDLSSKERFDVVWYRRPIVEPVLPDSLHPGDRVICRRECLSLTRGLWQLIGLGAFWVNPLASQQRANSKIVQLEEALAVGLDVPPTLLTNDPEEIRRFLRRYSGEAIYKAFNPAQWVRGEEIGLVFTSEVTVEDLPDDDVLRLCPGIFQRRVLKAYELRLTYMGDFCVAAKLRSQENPAGQLDWKGAFGDLRVEPTTLVPEVDRRCRQLLRRLGIVFGCLDLIVTPDGEYVFVEVNEMGQFLWLEELNPAIQMLEPFCEFLAQKRLDFSWHPTHADLRFADFYAEAIQMQEEVDADLHLAKPLYHSVDEGAPPEGTPVQSQG